AYAGKPVRWGGSIVSVNNEESGAWIEVVDHELNRYGMPEIRDRSPGRFMIRTAQFLDPAIYAPGRLVTVAGTLTGGREGSIGAYIYHFPVVRPINLHLWSYEAVHGRHRPRYHLGVHYGHGHFHRRGFHRHGYYSRFHRRY
ncbi:MAG: Slp family lipoprotein, partial [Gammaproteobacteria bacterium]